MISLDTLRIKTRIYTGFTSLIVIGLAVAGVGGWQLSKVDGQADHLVAVSENASRNLVAAGPVLNSADALGAQAEVLRGDVDRFLADIRAA